MMTDQIAIGQLAQQTELSIDTLRYYEKEGLIPNVERADNGHRRYSALDVEWVEFVKCLRAAKLPISLIREYVELGQVGPQTRPDRLSILQSHRNSLEKKITELSQYLQMVDDKIEIYHKTMAEAGQSPKKD